MLELPARCIVPWQASEGRIAADSKLPAGKIKRQTWGRTGSAGQSVRAA